MEVDASALRLRTYNVHAMSFTPEELAAEIKKHIPNFTISYQPDQRQQIGKWPVNYRLSTGEHVLISAADTWPQVFDDAGARADWNWNHQYGIGELCKVMIKFLQPQYK